MVKIWKVMFGHNYATTRVVAKNVRDAAKEARKIEKHIPKAEGWVSCVEMIAESEN